MNSPGEIIFFDGHCGLCHGFVRFVLRRDHHRQFVYAPLQGDTFRREVGAEIRPTLPDSVVIKTVDGKLLSQSTAVLHVFARLDGKWRRIGRVLELFPRPFLDFGYALIAGLRHRLYASPNILCPLIASDLRPLFLP